MRLASCNDGHGAPAPFAAAHDRVSSSFVSSLSNNPLTSPVVQLTMSSLQVNRKVATHLGKWERGKYLPPQTLPALSYKSSRECGQSARHVRSKWRWRVRHGVTADYLE